MLYPVILGQVYGVIQRQLPKINYSKTKLNKYNKNVNNRDNICIPNCQQLFSTIIFRGSENQRSDRVKIAFEVIM